MTNKAWLATLTDEKCYDEFKYMEQLSRWDINTRLAMIEWLGQEHVEEKDDDDEKE